MDALYAASIHSFFNNGDSSPTYRYCSRRIIRLCIFISYINLVASLATLPPGLYWKSMLSSTPMPKSIAVQLRLPGGGTAIEGKARASVRFRYGCCKDANCCQNVNGRFIKPDTALFFLEKDLKSGYKMNLLFENTSNQASFLPRDVVKSIPFSSTKMAQILSKFDVKPGSLKAEFMTNTIKVCEESVIKGEEKYCATSLESMLDFTILKLGKNVEALSTEIRHETKKQEYTIMQEGVEKMGETKVVVCHKLPYVYAVFYCHKIEKTVAYTVLLEGADGSRVKAVSVCHRDTSGWNPKHLAFQMLKVKPGCVPICHFLVFQDSVAWVPK